MFDKTQNQPVKSTSKDKGKELSDFVIHVMPESFKQKKSVLRDEKLVAASVKKPEKKPVLKKTLKKGLKPIPRKMPLPVKKKSKAPIVLALAGLFFVIILVLLGWVAIRSLEQEVVVEEVVIEVPVEVEPLPEEIGPGSDLDSDGLSDIEEGLYGTDARNPDSDNDTFLDGNEVFHRYSPLGEAPQTLLATGSVREYENEQLGFSLTYPVLWSVAAEVDAEFEQTQEIIFRTNSTATIRLMAQGMAQDLFEDWYTQNASGQIAFVELDQTLTKEGYMAYMNSDELMAYIEAGGRVYIFEYDLADELEIVYLQTFQMMINSFLIQ